MRDLIVAFVPSGADGGKGAGKRGVNGCSTKPIKALPEEARPEDSFDAREGRAIFQSIICGLASAR